MPPRPALRAVALVAGLSALLLAVRAWLAFTPALAETYYDEALTGLMALAILDGEPQVFYWGQPYLGAVDAYLAALGFAVAGPTTRVLRLATALTTVLWGWAALDLARRAAGERAGLLAGLYLAVPPVFLVYAQLSSHGESVAMSFGTATLALGAALAQDAEALRRRLPTWLALGATAGLAWWGSQMTAMLLLAAAAAALTARPRALRAPGPWVALGAFVTASLPLWAWNLRHDWATFRHLLAWGDTLPPWDVRVANVVRTFVASARGVYWDGRTVTLSPAVDAAGAVLVAMFCGAALALAAARLAAWAARLARGQRPWPAPLDAVALAFWLTVVAHLLTWFGTSGVVRYSMTFYATVPVLGAVALARLAVRAGRAGRAAALVAGLGLILYHGALVTAFVREAGAGPGRPVDAGLARMASLGLPYCYADSRVAQVLSFESAGRVTCADYLGLRDYGRLQAVDAAADPALVALVAHRRLRHPEPDVLAATLAAAGVESQRAEAGDYVIFHTFRLRPASLRPVGPAGWSARAGSGGSTGLAFDRRVWTRWVGPQAPGDWFELDLGRAVTVAQVTLEGGSPVVDAPPGLTVETSLDGRLWEAAARLPEVQPGLHLRAGQPRIDESARIVVRMDPRPARYIRVVRLGSEQPGRRWGLAEVFVYEAARPAWAPPPEAEAALEAAGWLLRRWMDDPTGPHPKRAPVTYEHRRAQVDWAGVSRALALALARAPEWEEAHHLYGRVLDMAGWADDPERVVERARRDGAWPEVLWAAAAAEAAHPGFWRAGRDHAAADALAALGHPLDAVGLARRPAPTPGWPVTADFGPGLTLLGLDLPRAARPGQTLTLAGHWEARGRLDGDLAVFVHLVGPGGRRLILDHRLGGDHYPASRWASGERVRQAVTVLLPADTPAGSYALRLGVWLPETGKRLRVTRADRSVHRRTLDLGSIDIGS